MNPKNIMRVLHHGAGRFDRVTLVPVLRQKSKSDVRIRKRVALYQATDNDRNTAAFQLDFVQSKAVLFVTLLRTVLNVLTRIVERTHAFIADVLNERGLVQQLDDKSSVVVREAPQNQSFCLKNFHALTMDYEGLCVFKRQLFSAAANNRLHARAGGVTKLRGDRFGHFGLDYRRERRVSFIDGVDEWVSVNKSVRHAFRRIRDFG